MARTAMFLASLMMAVLAFDGVQTLKYNSIGKYYSAYRRRCAEKSLEAREAKADAVFTGTIRDLIPDRRHPDTKVQFIIRKLRAVIRGCYFGC